jgi:hypothetical protein
LIQHTNTSSNAISLSAADMESILQQQFHVDMSSNIFIDPLKTFTQLNGYHNPKNLDISVPED